MENWNKIFPLFFVLLFLAVWLFVSKLLARIGGWGSFSHAYPAPDSFSGQTWNFQSAVFNRGTRYNHCLKISAGPQGVLFATHFLVRYAHPPFFIPWSDLSGTETKSFWGRWVKLEFARLNSVSCQIPLKLADRLEAASGGMWRYQRRA